MLRRLIQTIVDRDLIRRGQHIVVGCSGGADSVALLHGLWFLRDRLGFRLTAAHLHHGIRGYSADADEQFVITLCARRGIPVVCRRESVPYRQKLTGGSLEMTARAIRHDFFMQVLEQTGADAVALAHHRDDQAETVLMRLFAGGGMAGLGGMDYQSEPRTGLTVIRPLLDCSRSELVSFLMQYRLPWREDKSNRDTDILRNRIRHRLLPAIASSGFPHAGLALARFADMMREEARLAERQTEQLGIPRAPRALPLAMFRRRTVAEQRRMIRAWLEGSGIAARELDFELTERVRHLVSGKRSAPLVVGTGIRVIRTEKTLAMDRSNDPGVESKQTIPEIRINIPGVTEIPGKPWRVVAEKHVGFRKTTSRIGVLPSEVYIRREPDRVPPLVMRSRRAGDRIAPTGMTGSVSLKEVLINQKVSRDRRDMIPVLACGGDVVWMAGFRVARSWAVTGPDAPSWRVRIEQNPR